MKQIGTPVTDNAHLSSLSRGLVAAAAAVFGLLGLVLFVAPAWSAAHFPWKISALVAMTMGGWYLGSAAMAGLVAYHRRWNLIYASALYVGVFGVSEAAVLVVHNDKLKLEAALAWPYIGMLALAILASASILLDWARQRPKLADEGLPAPRWVRVIVVAFVVFVFLLAGVAFSGHWTGLKGVIFPEPLTLFTLRSFGAFYFSLAVSALAFWRVRRLAAVTVHVRGGLTMIVLITAAALVYRGSFDFTEHPFQSIYLGVYLAAMLLALFYLWYEHARRVYSK